MMELHYACELGGNIIGVILGEVELPAYLKMQMETRPIFRLSEKPTDEEMDRMMDYIGREIMK